jgi:hypothetical protein
LITRPEGKREREREREREGGLSMDNIKTDLKEKCEEVDS